MRSLTGALVTAGLTLGLLAATGSTSAFASTPAAPVVPASFVTALAPHADADKGEDHNRGDRHDGDRDRHDGDRDRDHDNDWVSADQCRDGGGHVDWNDHRCWGGRFDGFHV